MEVQFGRYVLERRLAVGGMAEVFLGASKGPAGFAKRLVIKRILPAFRDNPSFVQMFLDEATLGSRFDHPNLLQVFDLVEEDGQYAIVMELVKGKDLAQIIKHCHARHRMVPTAIAVRIIAGAALGLHHAHGLRGDDGEPLNVVHRDVSPANIVVTQVGGVKVVDFGVAKSAASSSNTRKGVVKGKFAYMSPEQVRAQPLDGRSDIFSLGATLYELLTLRHCFLQATGDATVEAILSGKWTPVSRIRHDLSASLEDELGRMLALDPDDRHADALEVAEKLRATLGDAEPSEKDIREFLTSLYGPTESYRRRWFTSVGDDTPVPVNDELSSPSVPISDLEHTRLLEAEPDDDDDDDDDDGDPTVVETAVVRIRLQSDTIEHQPAVTTKVPGPDGQPTAEPAATVPGRGSGSSRLKWMVLGLAVVVAGGAALVTVSRNHSPDLADPATTDLDGAVVGGSKSHSPESTTSTTSGVVDGATNNDPELAAATLYLSCTPAAEVQLDGLAAGVTPLHLEMTAGEHVVQVRVPRWGLKKTLRVKAEAGETIQRNLVFRKGRVQVRVEPWGEVFFRGRKLGMTPMAPFSLYEGRHELKIVNPNLNRKRVVSVDVRPGKLTTIEVEL